MYIGELISVVVALSWTACAMFAEVAAGRMGSLPFNVVRMLLSLLLLGAMMWALTGVPYPVGADADTWLWLSLSGLVGYVLGDFCLFNAYIHIGSRYGQLLMTLAPPAAALFGWLLLGQRMTALSLLGMAITVGGIALAISGKASGAHQGGRNRTRGILFGVVAGLCQGVGLVLSAKGLMHYEAAVGPQSSALLLPFSATAIRAVTGLVGFSVWTAASGQLPRLGSALTDRRAMLFALAATVTGPFIGVSLSLMATLYTSIGVAQTIMAMTPVLIIWPTYLFFRQPIRWQEVVGAVISICGVALFFV